MGCVYIIKNTCTDKCYVGLTVNTANQRFKKHISMIYSNGCSALYPAMVKYGTDKFYVETLFESENKKELMGKEQYYIKKYNTVSPCGYNLTTGGENCIVSQETRNKQSNALKGRVINWSKKTSEGVKKLWEDPEYRKKQTDQRHEKRGKYRKGIVREKLKKSINVLELKKDYESFVEISEIIKKHKISSEYIYRFIKREGIPKRGYKCNRKKE